MLPALLAHLMYSNVFIFLFSCDRYFHFWILSRTSLMLCLLIFSIFYLCLLNTLTASNLESVTPFLSDLVSILHILNEQAFDFYWYLYSLKFMFLYSLNNFHFIYLLIFSHILTSFASITFEHKLGTFFALVCYDYRLAHPEVYFIS